MIEDERVTTLDVHIEGFDPASGLLKDWRRGLKLANIKSSMNLFR
ncbi:hypothetical protein [Bradyrhizobium sp. LMG 9283]